LLKVEFLGLVSSWKKGEGLLILLRVRTMSRQSANARFF